MKTCTGCTERDATIARLTKERDGVMSSFEHDLDCSSLLGSGRECDCWLWLRWRKDVAETQVARLRKALEIMLDSAFPHPVEHPTMTEAWKQARIALTDTEIKKGPNARDTQT